MKKTIFLILTLLLITGNSLGQENIDNEKEEGEEKTVFGTRIETSSWEEEVEEGEEIIILPSGFSAELFYTGIPNPDGIAFIDDNSLLVINEEELQGVFLARRGDRFDIGDAFSTTGTPFVSPDDLLLHPDGTVFVADGNGKILFKIAADGGAPEAFVTSKSIDIPNNFKPFGIAFVPPSFRGPNVDPGDLIIVDLSKVVWAINHSTGSARAIAKGGVFIDGPLNVAFSTAGRLFVYQNYDSGSSRIVSVDAEGSVTPFLTYIPDRGALAINPVTDDIYFGLQENVREIWCIPSDGGYPRIFATGFTGRFQDMVFSPDWRALFVSTPYAVIEITGPFLEPMPPMKFALGSIAGTVTNAKQNTPYSDLTIVAYDGDDLVSSAQTDMQGRYKLMMRPGEYTVSPCRGQDLKSPDELALTVSAGQESKAELTATTVELLVTPLKGFPEASLTIFPVTYTITGPVDKSEEHRAFYDAMMGPASQEYFAVINTLGLLLEEKGYDKFEITETAFLFPMEKMARKDKAAAFGKFVSELDLRTDYALCTEFICHLEKSFQEVYSVIVDAKGDIVWEDSQGPGDSEFDKDFPGTPEKCCELVYRRLTPILGLDSLPKKELAEDKKQALRKMRAEEPPSQSEFAAIEKRLEAMKKAGASSRMMIYATRVGGDHTDQTSAMRLSELLSEAQLCRPTLAQTSPVLEGEGWPNEMKVLWLFAKAAREYARQHPVDYDYVLFADYWLRPSDNNVHAVHFVVCDRAGDWVIVDLQNSHQEDFQRIRPETLEDCDRLVLERIKKLIR
jgi:hypothetical protein